jgi:pyrimidine oxygenase
VKYGIFLPTASNGYVPSTLVPDADPTFADQLAITRRAEEFGFDFVLAMAKFRGPGGDTYYWEAALEALTTSAGLLSATERIQVIGSVGILSIHPAMAARMAATCDSIGPGRFGLNIVTGWNPLEYSQMGLWPGDEYFGYRYDYAREYVAVLRELWSAGRSSFTGEHFTLDDCHALPRPSGTIPIVCAGSSANGRTFAAECGDVNFTSAVGAEEASRDLRERAVAAGRTVVSNVLLTTVIADTDAEAWARIRRFNEHTDVRALDGKRASAARDTVSSGGTALRQQNAVSAIDEATVVAGSAQTVATKLREFTASGLVEGVSLQFDDFHDGLERFGRDVLPLLR